LAWPGPDGTGYERLALHLLGGQGFSLDGWPPFRPDNIRTPLYPAFIAAIYAVAGPSPRAVALVQAALDAATAVLVLRVAARLASPRLGLAAGLVYALTPTQWRFAASMLTEAPLAFLIATTVACLVYMRRPMRRAVAVGALVALAALCKPNV